MPPKRERVERRRQRTSKHPKGGESSTEDYSDDEPQPEPPSRYQDQDQGEQDGTAVLADPDETDSDEGDPEMSEREYVLLCRQAKAHGMSVGDYIRSLDRKTHHRDPKANQKKRK